MANRISKKQAEQLAHLLEGQDVKLSEAPRAAKGGGSKARKSNVHVRHRADADMVRKPPGTIICAGAIRGRAVPWKAPKVRSNGSVIMTPEYRSYKDWKKTVADFARASMAAHGSKPYGHPVKLISTFVMREVGAMPDLTNLVKAAEDGLQGVVFVNDGQVKEQDSFIRTPDQSRGECYLYVVEAI